MKTARTAIERLVAGQVSGLPAAESGRNAWGVLWFKWASPCPEIEALWLSVRQNEVVLSCKVAHLHLSRSRYLKEKLTNLRLKRRVASDAIKEARRFLQGETAVVVQLAQSGEVISSSWCARSTVPEQMATFSKPVHAWQWSGQIHAAA